MPGLSLGVDIMQENQQFEFLDIITIISFAMQLLNQQYLSHAVSNDDIMQELRAQDSKYLEQIRDQNNKIIELLQTSSDHSSQSTLDADTHL